MDNVNVYGVVYLFRVWYKSTPTEIAELLAWSEDEVWYAFHQYYERMSSWVKAKGRYPNQDDIDNGDFTLEPFDGLHYKRYIQEI